LRLALLILALLGITSCFSQKVLILEKIGKGKWFKYQQQDPINLMTRKDKLHLNGFITSINDSSLEVDMKYTVRLDDVDWVQRYNKHRNKNGMRVAIAGGVLIGIVTLNNVFNNDPVFDPTFLIAGAGITAAGLTWMACSKPRYQVGAKWKLKVLDYSIF
jgi:hypothetical protein